MFEYLMYFGGGLLSLYIVAALVIWVGSLVVLLWTPKDTDITKRDKELSSPNWKI